MIGLVTEGEGGEKAIVRSAPDGSDNEMRKTCAHPASWTEFETSGCPGEQGSTAFSSMTEPGSPVIKSPYQIYL